MRTGTYWETGTGGLWDMTGLGWVGLGYGKYLKLKVTVLSTHGGCLYIAQA